MRILLAEDDALLGDGLRAGLRQLGFQVDWVRDGLAAERELAMLLDAFDAALIEAYDKKAPNFIAEHAFKLAQSFSRFFSACPIFQAGDSAVAASRLALSATTLRQLEIALDLLGIETPERM